MPNESIERLANNVASAKHADELVALADARFIATPRFWERLAERAADELAKIKPQVATATTSGPMTDAEAREWGQNTVPPRGRYASRCGELGSGTTVDQIDLPYLLWWVNDDRFTLDLRRYLDSPRIRLEIERAQDA